MTVAACWSITSALPQGRCPRKLAAVVVLCAGCLVGPFGQSRAGEWPGWRGPTGDGYSNEKDLPLTWGGKTNENLLWQVKLDGRGSCSPIVWGDRVFLTS